jgi:5-methylcytosine-specific restriction endonuclease McrA
LDALVRVKMLERENGVCWLCGAQAAHLAHIIGRTHLGVRWDITPDGNCHLLCLSCHAKDHAGVLMPSYRDVYISRFGTDSFVAMWKRAQEVKWRPNVDLLDIFKAMSA